jgi:hypothetical protein
MRRKWLLQVLAWPLQGKSRAVWGQAESAQVYMQPCLQAEGFPEMAQDMLQQFI